VKIRLTQPQVELEAWAELDNTLVVWLLMVRVASNPSLFHKKNLFSVIFLKTSQKNNTVVSVFNYSPTVGQFIHLSVGETTKTSVAIGDTIKNQNKLRDQKRFFLQNRF
jgi:hypothetical protein